MSFKSLSSKQQPTASAQQPTSDLDFDLASHVQSTTILQIESAALKQRTAECELLFGC
jgi:hypothetical protein